MPLPTPASDASPTSIIDIIRFRAATDFFDPVQMLTDDEIAGLAGLATRAPSAYNLQNWRLDAVRTPGMKAKLRAVAFGQAKVEEAAVTFVVSGELADGGELVARLEPCVASGTLSAAAADSWVTMARASLESPERARDEVIRSATLLASTLMFAAEGHGYATAPMSGFDPEGVRRLLDLPDGVVPVLLVAVGRPLPGNSRQKPRRFLGEVLNFW